MASNPTNGSQLLVVSNTAGITVIDPSTPLKRLNYFDGKFLRASDFDVEQGYLRELVALGCHPRGCQGGDAGENICPKEDASKQSRRDIVTDVKPVSQDAL